ncbi:PQQ-binding-like beta-propeller repeat protein [Phycisphaeraceae bacterium D3-23]
MRQSAWTFVFAVLVLGCMTAGNARADWPQWRGPDGTGTAAQATPPSTLNPDTGENIRWTTDLPGDSAATPIVVADRVFTPAVNDNNRILAMGLDATTGEVLWSDDVAEGRQSRQRSRENNHAEVSPVADEEHVYFLFGTGDLIAYDHDGERQWHVNIVEAYGSIEILWGYGSSPLLLDGKLYIQVLRRDPASLLICVDADSGEILFTHERPSNARDESLEAYTTPIACNIDGQTQVVVYGGDALTGHDPATGDELWRFTEGLNPENHGMYRCISGPTQGLNGLIYLTTPRGHDLFAIEVTDNTPSLMWMREDVDADVPCPVYYDGGLFVFSGAKKRIYKLNADTGELVWEQRLDTSGYFRCTPTVAGGNVHVITADGELFILSAGDEFEQKSHVDLGGYPARASVAAAGNALYIRTGDRMICIAE